MLGKKMLIAEGVGGKRNPGLGPRFVDVRHHLRLFFIRKLVENPIQEKEVRISELSRNPSVLEITPIKPNIFPSNPPMVIERLDGSLCIIV